MDNKVVIASSLTSNELARALTTVVADRWDNMDLTPFLAYLVDTCATAALPYLADQFDVEGIKGFAVATTEAQQRELIKQSITLHRFIGTPWAIREACRSIGFDNLIIQEGVTPVGAEPDPETDWARFNVYLEGDRAITAEEWRRIRLFVEFYKNARSHLLYFGLFERITGDKIFRSPENERDELSLDLQYVVKPIRGLPDVKLRRLPDGKLRKINSIRYGTNG